MTREEAIELLCAYGVPLDEEKFKQALDMAIEALEQTDGDLISRDFMKKIGATCIAKRSETGELVAISSIDNLPSAEKTAEWIPCSERLPELHECKEYDMESSDYVLVYGITKDGESGVAISCYSKNYEGEGWCDAYIYIEFGQLEEIIAWMPLPEPYKAE